jgi:hypothetical protein
VYKDSDKFKVFDLCLPLVPSLKHNNDAILSEHNVTVRAALFRDLGGLEELGILPKYVAKHQILQKNSE